MKNNRDRSNSNLSLNVSIEIVGNGLCAVPENVRQTARNDTQVVPYKVFVFYTNTSLNRNFYLYYIALVGLAQVNIEKIKNIIKTVQYTKQSNI